MAIPAPFSTEHLDALRRGLSALGLADDEARAARMLDFAALVLEKNKVMNLTAITEPMEFVTKHLLDSAALLAAEPFAGKSVIDVGCGAGFPSMVLLCYDPALDITMLDSLKKRLTFIEEAAAALGVPARTIHRRAEEGACTKELRERFDIVTCRAVAALPQLTELCLGYVRPGGLFLPMKSAACGEELDAAAPAIRRMGGALEGMRDYTVPGTDIVHRVVRIRKTSSTPAKYPRRFAKIQTEPIR